MVWREMRKAVVDDDEEGTAAAAASRMYRAAAPPDVPSELSLPPLTHLDLYDEGCHRDRERKREREMNGHGTLRSKARLGLASDAGFSCAVHAVAHTVTTLPSA